MSWHVVFFCVFVLFSPWFFISPSILDILKPKMAHQKGLQAHIYIYIYIYLKKGRTCTKKGRTRDARRGGRRAEQGNRSTSNTWGASSSWNTPSHIHGVLSERNACLVSHVVMSGLLSSRPSQPSPSPTQVRLRHWLLSLRSTVSTWLVSLLWFTAKLQPIVIWRQGSPSNLRICQIKPRSCFGLVVLLSNLTLDPKGCLASSLSSWPLLPRCLLDPFPLPVLVLTLCAPLPASIASVAWSWAVGPLSKRWHKKQDKMRGRTVASLRVWLCIRSHLL